MSAQPQASRMAMRPAAATVAAPASAVDSSISVNASASPPPCPPELAAFISFLRSRSIRCVVFDLDRTLVGMHSGGCVPLSNVGVFAGSLMPASRLLLPTLVQEGFLVAVATFADDLYAQYSRGSVAGVQLVRRVLSECDCFNPAANAAALESIPIVTINPDLYHVAQAKVSKSSSAAAAEEQSRMQQHSNSSTAESPLRSFFHSKLTEFGLGPSHDSWHSISAFPPLPFKNHHLQLISVRTGCPLDQMLLLDDRDENVDAAREQGSWGLYLQGAKKGLTLADLNEKNVRAPQQHQQEAAGAASSGR